MRTKLNVMIKYKTDNTVHKNPILFNQSSQNFSKQNNLGQNYRKSSTEMCVTALWMCWLKLPLVKTLILQVTLRHVHCVTTMHTKCKSIIHKVCEACNSYIYVGSTSCMFVYTHLKYAWLITFLIITFSLGQCSLVQPSLLHCLNFSFFYSVLQDVSVRILFRLKRL